MVASNDSALYPNSSSYWADNGDGTRGFTSERACVTQDGYGYSARIASPCAVGTYNPRDTYSSCSACPTGLTTSGVGAGRTIADCGLAAGYGFHSGAVTACPLGKEVVQAVLIWYRYNPAAVQGNSTPSCTCVSCVCINANPLQSAGLRCKLRLLQDPDVVLVLCMQAPTTMQPTLPAAPHPAPPAPATPPQQQWARPQPHSVTCVCRGLAAPAVP